MQVFEVEIKQLFHLVHLICINNYTALNLTTAMHKRWYSSTEFEYPLVSNHLALPRKAFAELLGLTLSSGADVSTQIPKLSLSHQITPG